MRVFGYPVSSRTEPRFPGREAIAEKISSYSTTGFGGLVIAGAPATGMSTMLRRVHGELFKASKRVVPVFFNLEVRDRDAASAAERFSRSFISQVSAFRQSERRLQVSELTLSEASRTAAPEDLRWIQRAAERLNTGDATLDLHFATPLTAAAAGVSPFIIFDGLHNSLDIENGDLLIESLLHVSAVYAFPFVLAGRRRFVSHLGRFERIDLPFPDAAAAAEFTAELAAEKQLRLSDPARDLIAQLLGARPGLIEAVTLRAARSGSSLEGFPDVARAYTEEIFAGDIGRYFERAITRCVTPSEADGLVSALADHIRAGRGLIPADVFRHAAGIDTTRFHSALERLNVAELVRLTSGRVEPMSGDRALVDYLEGRRRLETLGTARANVFATSVSTALQRSPQVMAENYRASAAVDLRAILDMFAGQDVPAALFDKTAYDEKYKGKPAAQRLSSLGTDDERMTLPRVIFSAPGESVDPGLVRSAGRGRSVVAATFKNGHYREEDEIFWLAAEIDSKLPATPEIANEWYERLAETAEHAGFVRYQIWLVAPEGFDEEAYKLLTDRGAYGTSRTQAELLKRILSGELEADVDTAEPIADYEIVIPMGDETELIAAHTLEEIARRHGFKAHDINQIKTALVEACINAAEHSHSPDRRIHQKFTIGHDRIVITITNRGVRLADAPPAPVDSTRRGWGLKLIEKLMDDVRVDHTDDGTSISMTKFLAADSGGKNGL